MLLFILCVSGSWVVVALVLSFSSRGLTQGKEGRKEGRKGGGKDYNKEKESQVREEMLLVVLRTCSLPFGLRPEYHYLYISF